MNFYACIYLRLYHSYQDVEHSSVSEVSFIMCLPPHPSTSNAPPPSSHILSLDRNLDKKSGSHNMVRSREQNEAPSRFTLPVLCGGGGLVGMSRTTFWSKEDPICNLGMSRGILGECVYVSWASRR